VSLSIAIGLLLMMNLCIIIRDNVMFFVTYVRIRILGDLPSLNVSLSDHRVMDILHLIRSIPLPEFSDTSNIGLADEDIDPAVCLIYNFIRYFQNVCLRTETLVSRLQTQIVLISKFCALNFKKPKPKQKFQF